MSTFFLRPCIVLIVALSCIMLGALNSPAEIYSNNEALAGSTSGKALFDINVGSPQKIALYLSVIKQTHQDLSKQEYQPDFVVAFRGPSVRLVSKDIWSFGDEDQDTLKQAAGLIQELAALGVKFEACAIATSLFNVDNETILPEIKTVGNTFVSLIGYQSRGYAIIPIQ